MAGLDVHRFLTTTDPVELGVLQRTARRVLELRGVEREQQAILNRNHIVEGIFGK